MKNKYELTKYYETSTDYVMLYRLVKQGHNIICIANKSVGICTNNKENAIWLKCGDWVYMYMMISKLAGFTELQSFCNFCHDENLEWIVK